MFTLGNIANMSSYTVLSQTSTQLILRYGPVAAYSEAYAAPAIVIYFNGQSAPSGSLAISGTATSASLGLSARPVSINPNGGTGALIGPA